MDSLRVDLGRQGSSSGGGVGASSGGSRSFANSRTASHAPSPTLHSQHRDLPQRPFSPASSDAGSATSSTVQGDTSRRESLNGSMSSSRRLGSLQGAGLSSLSLALGADAGYTAGSSLVGFNAISTILNNPNKPQRPIDPSSSRYPPISQSHTELPKVKRSDFDATLQGIRTEWDRYQRNQKLGVRGRARLEAEDEEGRGERTEGEARRSGPLDDDDEETTARALGKKRLPPLSTVPQVFFSEDFDLGNPYTFDLVTERYKAASSSGASSSGPASNSRNGAMMSGYDVALNQMLQEKLSYYSDVVEQHLILEISARSSSFFAALGNLKDLEAESKNCLDKVEELKRELDDRDEGIAKAGLRLVREQAKQRETKERLEAVGLMHQLCEKRDLCQLLVQNNEWSEALDVMQNLSDLITGKAKLTPRQLAQQAILPPHVDLELASIPAVQAMSPQLHEMRNNIAAQLEVEVLSILMNDIEERVKGAHVPSRIDPTTPVMAQAPDATSDVAEASPPPAASNTDARASLNDGEARLADRLSAHIKGLVRTEGIDRAMAAYKEAMLKVPRTTMRTCLEKALGDGEVWLTDLAALLEDDEAAQGKADAKLGPGGAEAASKLQVLPFERFIALLHSLLKGLTGCVQAVDAQRRVLVKLLDDEGRRQEDASDAPEEKVGLLMPAGVSHSLPTTLAGIVTDVCSTSHVLASRLLSLRSTTHTGLPLPQFLAVFRLAWSFILESEALCGRMIIGLRGVVLNQAKSWLAYFHKTHIEKAAKAVEEEQWGQAEVSAKQQADIATIIDSATSDPPALLVNGEGEASPSPDDAKRKTLSIEEKQYFVVGASLDVLDMLVDYLRVVLSLPLLGTEIMGRIVEFLKQFNSRTCQVVLGAGAMRSAGLKNITAKHLALASQSLSIMITLIPYVRESVRRHLNPRQAVMLIEFDKLKRDYQEHQYEIHSKLVAIMSDRLTVHCRALANTDWSATIAEQDADVSAAALAPKPMLDLVKETTTLHKVLCKYLQPSVVELVIGQVLLSIDTRIAAELRKVESHDESSLKRSKSVVDHFNDKFGALKHVEWTAKELNAALQEQESEQDKAPPTPKKSVEEARPLSPIVTAPSPAPASPTHTPTSPSPAPAELPTTPTYTPRLSMTLQQRLAAAARRRAQSTPFSRPAATASAKVDEQAETAGGVNVANGSEREDEQVPAAIAKDVVGQEVTDSAKKEEKSAAKTHSPNGVEPTSSADEKEGQPAADPRAQDELRPTSAGENDGEQADAVSATEEGVPTAGDDAAQAEQPASATAVHVEEADTTSANTEQPPAAPADASSVEPEVSSVSAKGEEEPAATAVVVDEDKEAAAISVTEEGQQPTATISASNAGEKSLATTDNAHNIEAEAPTTNEDGEPVETSVPPSEDDRTAPASANDEEQPEIAASANSEGQAGDIPAEGGAKSAKKGKKKKKGKK